jgi:hypothetical protein
MGDHVDAHKEAILEALGPERDRTIEEVRAALRQQGLIFGFGAIQRFKRHAITRKKDRARHRAERPDILKRREESHPGGPPGNLAPSSSQALEARKILKGSPGSMYAIAVRSL